MKVNAATLAALALFFSTLSCAPLPSSEAVAPALGPVAEADAPFDKRAKVLTGSNSGPIPRWQTTYEYEPEQP